MVSPLGRVALHPFSAEEAQRVVTNTPSISDSWASDYPFEDELDVLRSFITRLGSGTDPHPFTLYRIDDVFTGLAVGGIGFFYEPDESGTTELGFGLVPSARGKGYATEALVGAVDIARAGGARRVIADSAVENDASQRVLVRVGFVEVSRADGLIFYAITC